MNDFRITNHAKEEMTRRSISQEIVEGVLRHPEQVVIGQEKRLIFQSQIAFEEGKMYLVRVIVDKREAPPAVLTVYRTSKINKYWNQS